VTSKGKVNQTSLEYGDLSPLGKFERPALTKR
jgi:hypothetical protein